MERGRRCCSRFPPLPQVTAIRIDVNRNRIIRTNLNLTMASVSLASMSLASGFLGMNLELPPWLDAGYTSLGPGVGPNPFLLVTGTSMLFGAAFYSGSYLHSRGWIFWKKMKLNSHTVIYLVYLLIEGVFRRNTRIDGEEIVALGRIFEDMSSIEHAGASFFTSLRMSSLLILCYLQFMNTYRQIKRGLHVTASQRCCTKKRCVN